MNIEKRLNSHTFLPGTERYTKPEEIKALGKFLKEVKKTQEEHTEIEENNLALPGEKVNKVDKNNPIIPGEMTSLPGQRLTVDGELVDIKNLPEDSLKITAGETDLRPGLEILEDHRENKLEDTRETITSRDLDSLDDTLEALDGVVGPEDLENRVLKISGSGVDIALPSDKSKLTVPESVSEGGNLGDTEILPSQQPDPLEVPDKISSLSSGRLEIKGQGDKELETGSVNIKKPKDLPLETSRENIKAPSSPALETGKENIRGSKDIPLENSRENIKKPKDQSLEDTKEIIKAPKDTPLETEREIIQRSKDVPLEDSKEIIRKPKDLPLETTKEVIGKPKDQGLENEVLKIKPKSTKNLETSRENLIDKNQPKDLPKNINRIQGNEEGHTLEDEIDMLEGKDTPNLPSEALKISESGVDDLSRESKNLPGDPKEVGLSEEVKEISASVSPTLESGREELLGTDKGLELSGGRIELEIPGEPTLPEDRVDITTGKDINLPEERKDLQDNRDINLGEERKTINPIEISSLESGREDLVGGRAEVELEEGKIKLQESTKDQELSEERLDIQEKIIDSLHSGSINLPGDTKEPSLSEESLKITTPESPELSEVLLDIQPTEDMGLSDFRENLEDTRDLNLEETRLDFEDSRDTQLQETRLDLQRGDQELGLEDILLDLQDSRENLLSDTLINLHGPEDIENLENTRLDFEDSREVTLLDTILGLTDEKVIEGLEDTRLDIEGGESKELDTTRLDIDGPEEINLSDTLLGISKPEDLELEDKKLDITPGDLNNLEEKILNIQPTEDIENLENTRLDFEDSRDNTLMEDYIPRPDNSDISGRTIIDLNPKVKDPEYTIKEAQTSERERILRPGNSEEDRTTTPGYSYTTVEDSEILSDLDGYGESGRKEAPGNADLTDRTIIDLDKTQKDPEYEIKEATSKGDYYITRPENSEIEDRTIIDLNPKVKDPEYEIKESQTSERERILRPKNAEDTDKTIIDIEKRRSGEGNLSDLTPEEFSKFSRDRSFGEDQEGNKIDTRKYSHTDGKEFTVTKSGYSNDPNIISLKKSIEESNSITDETEVSLEEEKSIFSGGGWKKHDSRDIPKYKLPEIGWGNFWSGNALNPSTYLRWAVDNTVGAIPLRGAAKQKIIDETLAFLIWGREALEKLTKANRDRLPGGDMGLLSDLVNGSLNVKSAAKSVLGAVGSALSNSVNHKDPINRPNYKKDEKRVKSEKWISPGQEVKDNTATEGQGGGGFWKKLGQGLIGGGEQDASPEETRLFKDYLNFDYDLNSPDGQNTFGIGTTMLDLFRYKKDAFSSLEDFRETLVSSRYITVPEKFTSTSRTTNYMTLDSNHIWEIIIRPFAGQQNGLCTWLPSLLEIDSQNKKAFNYTTHYSSGWLPITGFELQEKKLTSKELPLYDGSISYPVSLEFTNELRITLADDSLKSLKRYFDLCAKVSAYMSNIHSFAESGYLKPIDDPSKEEIKNPTVYLEGKIHPGLYKNLSFLVSIYILTPQYGTIKKCNLLCVLKDYTIENQGEMDSSPTELNVTFSIVGENPVGEETSISSYNSYEPPKKTGQIDRTGTGILDNLGSIMDVF